MIVDHNAAANLSEGRISMPALLRRSFLLKACIFATGFSGIVAEYAMATLASYLLGNSVRQWTLTISIMLFAMGLGSRISKHLRVHLLDAFLVVELALSVLCAVSALLAYMLSAYVQDITTIIYLTSAVIGVLIGLEIPLVTRLNDYFEELRVNISTVMEKDYYGALLGGLLFAFVALPYWGLTYTPIIVGTVNFIVAAALFWNYRGLLQARKKLTIAFAVIPLVLGSLAFTAKPIVLFGEQQKYRDRVIYQEQTPYQKIVLTQWREHFWLYLDGNEQFSSYDEERYHEPLVHPAMRLGPAAKTVLILGGGDGLAAREVLKYSEVRQVTLVDIDPAITRLAQTHDLFLRLNRGALQDGRVHLVHQDAYRFLQEDDQLYDVIIIDLPDPKTIEVARLYTLEFYQLAARHLAAGGRLVTQATSPFFSKQAFLSILKTMRAAGLPAIAYHNHIPTMGEWGWVLGVKSPSLHEQKLKEALLRLSFEELPTRFLNAEAMAHMLNFGKGVFDKIDEIAVTNELDLAVYHYYRQGEWDIY